MYIYVVLRYRYTAKVWSRRDIDQLTNGLVLVDTEISWCSSVIVYCVVKYVLFIPLTSCWVAECISRSIVYRRTLRLTPPLPSAKPKTKLLPHADYYSLLRTCFEVLVRTPAPWTFPWEVHSRNSAAFQRRLPGNLSFLLANNGLKLNSAHCTSGAPTVLFQSDCFLIPKQERYFWPGASISY